MKKLNIGIFLSLLLMVGLCSCGEQKSNTKLVLNEVLIENESNFQDVAEAQVTIRKQHLMKISQQYPEKMDQEQEELSLSYSELNRKIKMEIK